MVEITFKKGDSIVLGNYGAGYIDKVGYEEVLDKKIKFFEIKFVANEMKILIPVSEIESSEARKPASKQKLNKALSLIKRPASREQEKEIKKKYEDGIDNINNSDILLLAELIFFLSKKNSFKPISITEKRILHQAVTLMASEIAVINKISLEKAEEKIKSLISK